MQISKATLISFSPTGTTNQVLEAIAEGMDVDTESIVMARPGFEAEGAVEIDGDVAVVGVPVYAGRVPREAARRLGQILGRGKPAVAVVCYGNRDYDDALVELCDLCAAEGRFIPVAGAAFIGEHSYATLDAPIALGRPDSDDRKNARRFGRMVLHKLAASENLEDMPEVRFPGDRPYKDFPPAGEPFAPETDPERCDLCRVCAEICPTGAVTVTDSVSTDAEACIHCCACTKACPEEARYWDSQRIARIRAWLTEKHLTRKEPEVFL